MGLRDRIARLEAITPTCPKCAGNYAEAVIRGQQPKGCPDCGVVKVIVWVEDEEERILCTPSPIRRGE